MIVEDHVTGMVADDGIWMGCSIVSELDNCIGGGTGGLGFCSGNGPKGNEHGGVNGDTVVY
jgi:hypothetical protein